MVGVPLNGIPEYLPEGFAAGKSPPARLAPLLAAMGQPLQPLEDGNHCLVGEPGNLVVKENYRRV